MRRVLESFALATLLAPLAGCNYEEIVTNEDPAAQHQNADDAVPLPTTFDSALGFSSRHGPENYSSRRFRLDVGSFDGDAQKAEAAKLWRSHAELLRAHPDAIPSVQTASTAAKQLDDTLYAGVERAVQDGLGATVLPKRAILSESVTWLAAHRSADADLALIYAGAALELGGATSGVPADLTPGVEAAKAAFLAKPTAKPIGFYTWSKELEAIWVQDRFLQTELAPGAACALASAIADDPDRAARYRALVSLYDHLTNPVKHALRDILPASPGGACSGDFLPFLGSSRSVEVALFEKLYPDGIPANADLMQDLVDAIRAGTVDLTPRPEDGWYAWQEWALETLLVTDKAEERAKVAFTARYKRRLQEAFESMLVQHRETHVKQLDTARTVSIQARENPEMRVEPLATVYVRHARGYVVLEAALDRVLGPTLLDSGVAVGAPGKMAVSLRARLHQARDLYYGLYLVACQDLGLKPRLDAAGDPDPSARDVLAATADHWLAGLATDPLAAADVRVMVPIAELSETRSKYWVVIGVRSTLAAYSFIDDAEAAKAAPPEKTQRAFLPTEQFLEVESSAVPLDRDELRALCDREGTAEKIKAALEAR
jgi:hypothetical protein